MSRAAKMANHMLQYILMLWMLSFPTFIALSVSKSRVLVFGASRSAGMEVFKKLMKKSNVDVVGVVRSKRGVKSLKNIGADDSQIRIADITDREAIREVFRESENCRVIFCISSQPKRRLMSFVKSALFRVTSGKYKPKPGDFYFPHEATPYDINYVATKNCIDAAVSAKCEHFILLTCMGGYRQTELNEIGRSPSDEEKLGNIFKWRRACERYLMKRLFFTIIHSGTLTDESGGNAEVVWDTDDALLRGGIKKISKVGNSPRDTFADLIIQKFRRM